MDFIKEINIKNFRSIKRFNKKLTPTHLNIFVGQNDQGKSNILRALNLFFNNQTDLDNQFRFDDDYCYKAPTGRGTRIEIKVELLVQPPKNRFRQHTPVHWTKIWKKDGSIREYRKHPDGSELSDRNNVSQWLNKLRYRYVPAVKGQEYFSNLMGELHDVLSTIHSDVFAKQGEGFISGIQDIMEEITTDLDKELGIPNTIQVPSDFKSLFSNLDFGAQEGGHTYHLKQRGDGIKVRHIPIILKYMSAQEKVVSKPGYVKPDTIWGFEEPENNLEFRYAFEIAETLKRYSEDVQIFLTTHSPAFYSLDKDDNDGVKVHYVYLNEDSCTEYKDVSHDDNEKIHENMGFLPIITPYLNEIYQKDKELNQAINRINKLEDNYSCYLLTEDADSDALCSLLEHNGFNINDTEIVPYHGADSFHAAITLGKYIQSKQPSSHVVVHRDRDYLTNDELDILRNKCINHGFYFITTLGTDIESFFISADHICSLYGDLDIETVEELISSATEESLEDSLSRLINRTLTINKPYNSDYYKKIEELKKLYSKEPERYRYGKKVLGRLKGKLQHRLGENPDLLQYSDYVVHEELTQIASNIWGDG